MTKEKIVINDHIQGDPLSEENLDKTLKYLHKIRLLMPEKTIWLYTGYTWEQIYNCMSFNIMKRRQIISQCDVMIDGRYIDSQRNIAAKWKGSNNQRVIDIQKSLQQSKVVLYCD